MTTPIVWLASVRSTRIWSAAVMARLTSPLVLCLAGMSVDSALNNRLADPRLLLMCSTFRATTAGVFGAHASVMLEGMQGLNLGTAAAAFVSVCIGCRANSAGDGWVRFIRSLAMVITMLAGMLCGCCAAVRLAASLRIASPTMLIWAMMALGMLVAHGILLVFSPPYAFRFRKS